MKTLKSRLFEHEQDQKRAAMEKFYGEKGEIGWGNQIRSYVFQPLPDGQGSAYRRRNLKRRRCHGW